MSALLLLDPTLGAVEIILDGGTDSGTPPPEPAGPPSDDHQRTWWGENPPPTPAWTRVTISTGMSGSGGARDPASPALGRDHLSRIRHHLERAVRGTQPQLEPVPADVWEACRAHLDARFGGFHPFSILPQHQQGPGVVFTAEQERVRAALADSRRVTVLGPAGSGKTMLAVDHALTLARAHQRTLFLCANPHLATFIKSRICHRDLEVTDLQSLVKRITGESGVRLNVPVSPHREVVRFWRELAPSLLERALDGWATRFDRLVVDEVESFAWQWWPAIERLSAGWLLGPLTLFQDSAQASGEAPLMLPETDVTLSLTSNLRAAPELVSLAERLLGQEARKQATERDSAALEILLTPASPERPRKLESVVEKMLESTVRNPGHLAILGPRSLPHSSLRGVKALADHSLLTDLAAWEKGEGILYSDLDSFRGLDARAVILIDVDRFTPSFSRGDLYIACTRARDSLTVVLSEGEVASLLT